MDSGPSGPPSSRLLAVGCRRGSPSAPEMVPTAPYGFTLSSRAVRSEHWGFGTALSQASSLRATAGSTLASDGDSGTFMERTVCWAIMLSIILTLTRLRTPFPTRLGWYLNPPQHGY